MSALLVDTNSDKRKFQRVKVNLPGRFMLPNREEYPCQAVEMSPGDIVLFTPVKGEIGDRIVAYVEVLGRVSGNIARLFEGGFALKFHVSPLKQDRLADKLTWLANKDTLSMPEDRRHGRIAPDNPVSHLTLPDGRSYECQIMDISLSGAAVTAPVCPDIYTHVTLGKMHGKVVRHLDKGFAIEFNTPSPSQHL